MTLHGNAPQKNASADAVCLSAPLESCPSPGHVDMNMEPGTADGSAEDISFSMEK